MKGKVFNEILLRRRNKINVNVALIEEKDNIDRVIIMMKNINNLGYSFSKELINVIRFLPTDVQNDFYKELVTSLKEYTGADKKWEPMYPNFPSQVQEMDDWELFINAIIHYFSDGVLLPAYEKDERLPLFESPDLTILDIGTDEDLDEVMNNLITSKTSLSETDKTDMIWLIQNKGVDYTKLPDEISFKENVAIICKLIMDNTSEIIWYNVLHKYLKTATDILRFVTYLSDGDVSLAADTKYKSFSRKHRRLILRLLDTAGNIEEDMLRYKTKWIRLGERLHPSEYKEFNNVCTAFDKLRNNGDIKTFNSKLEKAINNRDIIGLLTLLKTRPGEFARRLDDIIRDNITNAYNIVYEFGNIADKISVPVLLQVREHFLYRCDKNDSRVFFPKGSLAKVYTINNELKDIPIRVCAEIIDICERAIIEQFKSKDSLGKVYIDDSIKGYCVPQSQRSASSTGKRNITRGSRFKIKKDSKFIRLGIHWMNELYNGREDRTDIDLSCTFLDENFSYLSHVSYTNLRNNYCCHSGDIVNANRASGGATEFVDIDIDKAKQNNIKYAAIQVYGFTNSKFCDLDDMLFTWQEGVDSKCGDIFEASRIQQCVNLGGDTLCEIPVIFDLENQEVIWCDLALTTRTDFPRCVEGNIRGLSAIAMGICQSNKPQMYDLAILNAKSHGNIVTDRNEADTIFDINTEKPIIRTEKTIEVQNEKGEVIDTRIEIEEKVKDCRIITPYDIDIWMGEML